MLGGDIEVSTAADNIIPFSSLNVPDTIPCLELGIRI